MKFYVITEETLYKKAPETSGGGYIVSTDLQNALVEVDTNVLHDCFRGKQRDKQPTYDMLRGYSQALYDISSLAEGWRTMKDIERDYALR